MRHGNLIRGAIVGIPGVIVLALWTPDTWPATLLFVALVAVLGVAAGFVVDRRR
jgi:uncharacterized membrane protein YccC